MWCLVFGLFCPPVSVDGTPNSSNVMSDIGTCSPPIGTPSPNVMSTIGTGSPPVGTRSPNVMSNIGTSSPPVGTPSPDVMSDIGTCSPLVSWWVIEVHIDDLFGAKPLPEPMMVCCYWNVIWFKMQKFLFSRIYLKMSVIFCYTHTLYDFIIWHNFKVTIWGKSHVLSFCEPPFCLITPPPFYTVFKNAALKLPFT